MTNTHVKHLEESLLWYHKALKLLLLLDRHVCDLLEGGVVVASDWPTIRCIQSPANGPRNDQLTSPQCPSHRRNLRRWEDPNRGGSHNDVQTPHQGRVQTSARTPFCLEGNQIQVMTDGTLLTLWVIKIEDF